MKSDSLPIKGTEETLKPINWQRHWRYDRQEQPPGHLLTPGGAWTGGGVYRTEDRANIVRSPNTFSMSYLSVLAVESRATFGPHFPIPVSHLQAWGPRHGRSLSDTESRRGKTLSREVRMATRRHACDRYDHGGARVSTSATLRITTRP